MSDTKRLMNITKPNGNPANYITPITHHIIIIADNKSLQQELTSPLTIMQLAVPDIVWTDS